MKKYKMKIDQWHYWYVRRDYDCFRTLRVMGVPLDIIMKKKWCITLAKIYEEDFI